MEVKQNQSPISPERRYGGEYAYMSRDAWIKLMENGLKDIGLIEKSLVELLEKQAFLIQGEDNQLKAGQKILSVEAGDDRLDALIHASYEKRLYVKNADGKLIQMQLHKLQNDPDFSELDFSEPLDGPVLPPPKASIESPVEEEPVVGETQEVTAEEKKDDVIIEDEEELVEKKDDLINEDKKEVVEKTEAAFVPPQSESAEPDKQGEEIEQEEAPKKKKKEPPKEEDPQEKAKREKKAWLDDLKNAITTTGQWDSLAKAVEAKAIRFIDKDGNDVPVDVKDFWGTLNVDKYIEASCAGGIEFQKKNSAAKYRRTTTYKEREPGDNRNPYESELKLLNPEVIKQEYDAARKQKEITKPASPSIWVRIAAIFSNKYAKQVDDYKTALSAYEAQQRANAPKAEAPKTEVPKAEVPKAESSKAKREVPFASFDPFYKSTQEYINRISKEQTELDPAALTDPNLSDDMMHAVNDANITYQVGIQRRKQLLNIAANGYIQQQDPDKMAQALGDILVGEMVRRGVQQDVNNKVPAENNRFYNQMLAEPDMLKNWKNEMMDTPAVAEFLNANAETKAQKIGNFVGFRRFADEAIMQVQENRARLKEAAEPAQEVKKVEVKDKQKTTGGFEKK